jgi:hypothetical protein
MHSFDFVMLFVSDCMSCVIVVVVVAMLPAATRMNLCAAAHMHDITTTILHDKIVSRNGPSRPSAVAAKQQPHHSSRLFQQAGLFHGHWTFAAAGSDAE